MLQRDFWRDKRVFLTGHTGFKGAWLALWLAEMGAEVHGYALESPTKPSFHAICDVPSCLVSEYVADIRDGSTLSAALHAARPEIVLHLAAQSLVRRSYDCPVDTYATNVMGTVNVLEAARGIPGLRAIVVVTTDKCYENREWIWPYREDEQMGGHDPYSSSKGCAELVTAAYRSSFLTAAGIHVASARAGNVIGGGDWASDRLLPDFLRALDAGRTLTVRSPLATRPWQHVLEPLSGYLTLAQRLVEDEGASVGGWNFGPDESDARPVRWIVERLCKMTPDARYAIDTQQRPHEANYLKLDSSKAKSRLGWHPRWNLAQALDQTLGWHHAWRAGHDMKATSLAQIHAYETARAQTDD